MKRQNRCIISVVALFVSSAVNVLSASEPAPMWITTECLCQGCVGKISATLRAMPGVQAVQVNLPAKTVVVFPQRQAILSPRALWEAVEKCGERPLRLQGPYGTFTSRPKF